MKKTKCLNLYGIGDLRLAEKEIPELADDEVLVKVRACGICGSDIGRVFAHGTYNFPTVIGHEFSGEVIFDGKGELSGKRVSVFPLLPCFKCRACKNQNYACCENYDYYGSRRDGGFTEYIPVKKFNLVPLPDNVSFEEGAMCEPAAVSCHAVKKLGLKGGERVLISGAGPIGIIAARWALSKGAKSVSFIENDPDKTKYAEALGFGIHKDGDKYDCAIEGTGASLPLAMIISSVGARGTVVLMGNPVGDIKLSAKDYQRALRSELTILGTWNSSYSELENDWVDTLSAISQSKLYIKDLITHNCSFNNILDAFKIMRDKSEFFVKILLVN